MQPQAMLMSLVQTLGPVVTAVLSVLLMILGVVVITHPDLLGWIVGLALVLAGVALLASLFLATSSGGGNGRR